MKKVCIYIRVSRNDLNPDNQKLELEAYAKREGWDYEIFEEKESTRKTRPIKKDIFNRACWGEFDTILIYKLDRWARSMKELVYDLDILKQNKVKFIALRDNIILDDDARNMLMVHILGAFSEFEREIIRERTMAGLDRARAEGKKLGRRFGSKDKKPRAKRM